MRRLKIMVAVAAAGLLAGACSTGGAPSGRPVAAANAEAPTTTQAPVTVAAPLTGLPVDPADVARPAVSIKVDNSPQGRPQAGLDKADVVFEERVEGGVTRFIAVYHSQEADLVGPIRSLRTSDPAIVSAVGGVFVFSDGVTKSLSRLKGAPVTTVSERDGAEPFTYPKGRVRPWATFGATDDLRDAGASSARPPQALFQYGDASAGTSATVASADFGGKTTAGVTWDAAAKKWLRVTNGAPHLLADGSRLSFTNVIIQRTPYKFAGYKDSAGFRVDEAMVVGAGDAIVLVDGKQVAAKWSKPTATAATTYTDAAGAPIRLLPGPTLVMLPPAGSPVTVS